MMALPPATMLASMPAGLPIASALL
jgi:hypothetical protein